MSDSRSSASVSLAVPGHVALGSLAAVCLILGVALGRACAPWVCPVGPNEFKAKVVVCDDGQAYTLVPEAAITVTSTVETTR